VEDKNSIIPFPQGKDWKLGNETSISLEEDSHQTFRVWKAGTFLGFSSLRLGKSKMKTIPWEA
jgi:hypothetical protein